MRQILILRRNNVYIIERDFCYGINPDIYYLYRIMFIGRYKLRKECNGFALYDYAPGLDRGETHDGN